MRNQKRVQLRCKEALHHASGLMEALGQVVAEGGTECDAVYNRLRKIIHVDGTLSKAILKAYHYGEKKGKAKK